MTPCENITIIEKMRNDMQMLDKKSVRLEERIITTCKATEKLEKHAENSQYWLISILITIVGTFIYERMF